LVVYEGIAILIIVPTTVFVFVRYQSTIRELHKTLAIAMSWSERGRLFFSDF